MSNPKTNEDFLKMMETASFELDTDLRLHPQRLQLGKAELLTDALTLPFTDIERQLNKYVVGGSTSERDFLRKQMKTYLGRLNANPMIPLHFRLKVLTAFEKELELFDAELTAAVLNAHKIGVDLVQKAARSEKSYYRVLVDMVSSALELAVQVLRFTLEQYQATAVIATRQVFDLSKLGLSVCPLLGKDAKDEKTRLYKAICRHELLRKLDFFGKSRAVQKMSLDEMNSHIGVLEPVLCRKDVAAPKIEGNSFFITNLAVPNRPTELASKLPESFKADVIIFPMDQFIERLVLAIDRVEGVLKNSEKQRVDLHTEEALKRTIVGGNALLDTLRNKPRSAERGSVLKSRIILNWDPVKAISEAHNALVMSEYEYAPQAGDEPEAWSINNHSKEGLCLERIYPQKIPVSVDALVGLSWVPHRGEPMLAFVRWIKEPKPGEQQIGLQFFGDGYKLYKAAIYGVESAEGSMRRSWPILLKPGKQFHHVLFPDKAIYPKMTFVIRNESTTMYFKVLEVEENGENFSMCKIVMAKGMESDGGSLDIKKR